MVPMRRPGFGASAIEQPARSGGRGRRIFIFVAEESVKDLKGEPGDAASKPRWSWIAPPLYLVGALRERMTL